MPALPELESLDGDELVQEMDLYSRAIVTKALEGNAQLPETADAVRAEIERRAEAKLRASSGAPCRLCGAGRQVAEADAAGSSLSRDSRALRWRRLASSTALRSAGT
jgi:hypothetical protein